MATFKHEDGSIETSDEHNHQEEVDRFDSTERAREHQRQAAYQRELSESAKAPGFVPEWRRRELAEQDRIDAMFRLRRHFAQR